MVSASLEPYQAEGDDQRIPVGRVKPGGDGCPSRAFSSRNYRCIIWVSAGRPNLSGLPKQLKVEVAL